MFNALTIIGRLGSEVDKGVSPKGTHYYKFAVAVDLPKKEEEGDTFWVHVTLFGDRYEKIVAFLKKGSKVCVTGTITEIRTFKNKMDLYVGKLCMIGDRVKLFPSDRTGADQGHVSPITPPATPIKQPPLQTTQYTSASFEEIPF